MSVDFVKEKVGSRHLAEARRQQKQLAYFTQSCIQEELTQSYVEQWVNRKYANSDDYFLNWIKNILKQANFMAFFKHHRKPLASSRLVNDRMKPDLERVFHAEDSYFKYTIGNKVVEQPEGIDAARFNDMIFNAFLFRFNDILVSDLDEKSLPVTHLVDIENVVAIESCHNVIERIAYCAEMEIEGEDVEGYLYVDSVGYTFYNKNMDETPLFFAAHYLDYCPAFYVTRESFDGKCDIVRKSLFSYVREELEEYSFLKTLLKMTEANGVLPVTTMLKTKINTTNSDSVKAPNGSPMALSEMGGQSTEFHETSLGDSGSGALQPGTLYTVPPIKKEDGSLDMDAVKNFINFFYLPIEPLKYIEERIKKLEDSIINSVIGIVTNQDDSAKNELQVESGFVSAEDKLRSVSISLSSVRRNVDFTNLALKYGVDRVMVDLFYGSKFFMDSLTSLYALFKESPNPLERRNILIRISTIRNKFNADKAQREKILYSLIPYVADEDFKTAIDSAAVDETVFQIQTRFNYWINHFESAYGDIVGFWDALGNMKDSEKLLVINNLIIDSIEKEETAKKPTPEQTIIKKLGRMPELIATSILESMSGEQKMQLINLKYSPQAMLPPKLPAVG